jgi:hypothetical protein
MRISLKVDPRRPKLDEKNQDILAERQVVVNPIKMDESGDSSTHLLGNGM